MTQNWQQLPAPARPIASAASAAVSAAQARDPDGLAAAVDDLAALDVASTGLILGTTVRLLLEDAHPHGIDGDAVREALEQCVRQATQWQPDVDPHVVLLLLAGALGIQEEDGATLPKPDDLARHSALLLADLLVHRPLEPWLTATMAHLRVHQLND